jgi:hypothetical protein
MINESDSSIAALKLISEKPNLEDTRKFYNHVINCDYEISSSLKDKLVELNKEIDHLNESEILGINQDVFFASDLKLYNFVDKLGNRTLPLIYTDLYDSCEDTKLFCLGKYGIQSIDLFSISGKKIFKDAWMIDLYEKGLIGITDEDLSKKIYRYNITEESINYVFESDSDFFEPFHFNESNLFYKNGYLSDEFNPTTPFCFDNGKEFSEGLAPVCLNGKWGFINKQSEIVIDCQYGDAYSFENGVAKVFELNPEYRSENGIWVDINSFDFNKRFQSDTSSFSNQFPEFPKKIRKPLPLTQGEFKNIHELIRDYHFFGLGIEIPNYLENSLDLSALGEWINIDKNGNPIKYP